MYLCCYASDHPTSWILFLPWAEYRYNTSYQTAAQMTHFEVLYGRFPPTIARYVKDDSGHPLVDAQLLERDHVLQLLKINLAQAQARMKFYADKHRRDISFNIGDWLYVKLQPYRQSSIRLQRYSKLGRRYFGPYQVLKRVGPVAYELDLPSTALIHPVFHVSMLKKCLGHPDQQVTPLDLVDSTSSINLYPIAVLDRRQVQRGSATVRQCLIQWNGLTIDDATWEDNEKLHQLYLAFHLEDKVHLDEEGTVLNPNAAEGPAGEYIAQRN
ncbi:hypothetical protein E1A91_D13G220200v1 [Gossypium mustelinum]|uniref:Tf2-1-like SH3-like domain-containing protein n=1 Tax=Gossypium mustelinum TaxID=34275 RepID=A0A5D2S7D9_GOSMU|nr:hypothetical protein E1A91_D13G220200v1 [Gossypium mustelinum]